MRISQLNLICLALSLTFPALLKAQSTSPSDPSRLLVIYNDAWPDQNQNGIGDSEELARDYAKARSVPASNLLALTIPGTSRAIGGSGASAWVTFHDRIVTPLKAKLASLGPTKIDGFLLCYGVPYRINSFTTNKALRAIDHLLQVPDALGDRTAWGFNSWWATNPYFESSPGVAGDKGRFEHQLYRYSGKTYYLVTRLDGFDLDAAQDLIFAARYSETFGSKGQGTMDGNAYIDTRYGKQTDTWLRSNYPGFPGYSTYKLWDMRMAYGKLWPEAMGIPTLWEASGKEIGEAGAKFTNGAAALTAADALLYFGWYNYNQYRDVWNWLPGSVACDLNSNSIAGFDSRTATRHGFLTKAFERGLCAGAGVIAEPYLSGHARPEILLYYLLKGYTFAECAALADPTLFWRGVRMGDPLYAPYRTGLQRRKDLSQPLIAATKISARSGTSVQLDLSLVRDLNEPEVGRASIAYGETPGLGKLFEPNMGHHTRQVISLEGLDPAVCGYYARVSWTDPAQNKSTAPFIAITARDISTIDVHLTGPASIKKNGLLAIRYALGASHGVFQTQSFAMEIRQTQPTQSAWLDITGLGLARELAFGPEGEAILFEMQYIFPLQGTFEVRFRAANAQGSDSQSFTFTSL